MADNPRPPEWVDLTLSNRIEGLLVHGESQAVEYKETFPDQARDLAKEIAAFATSNNGIILIGVSDVGEVVGISNSNDPSVRAGLRDRIEGLSALIEPMVVPTIGFAWFHNKAVFCIEVAKGAQPLYFVNNVPYLRQLSVSRPAKPHEVIELVLASSRPVSGEDGIEALSSLYSLPGDHFGIRGLVPGVAVSRLDETINQPREVHLVGSGYMTLKVGPSMPSHHWTQTELRDLIASAPDLLSPLYPTKFPLKWSRNDAGAAIWAEDVSAPHVTRAATQLDQHGTIWTVDCVLLDAERLKADFRTSTGFIPTGAFESAFGTALPRFVKFANDHLKFSGPLTINVGVCRIKGYRLAVGKEKFAGYVMHDAVYDSFSIDDPTRNYDVSLRGFFRKVWDAAGLVRPDDGDAELGRDFGHWPSPDI